MRLIASFVEVGRGEGVVGMRGGRWDKLVGSLEEDAIGGMGFTGGGRGVDVCNERVRRGIMAKTLVIDT